MYHNLGVNISADRFRQRTAAFIDDALAQLHL
jgi:hypothetical protein